MSFRRLHVWMGWQRSDTYPVCCLVWTWLITDNERVWSVTLTRMWRFPLCDANVCDDRVANNNRRMLGTPWFDGLQDVFLRTRASFKSPNVTEGQQAVTKRPHGQDHYQSYVKDVNRLLWPTSSVILPSCKANARLSVWPQTLWSPRVQIATSKFSPGSRSGPQYEHVKALTNVCMHTES